MLRTLTLAVAVAIFVLGSAWGQSYTVTDLGDLGGANGRTWANAINNNGQVTGYSSATSIGELHAFRWNSGTMTDLGTLYGGNSYGTGINSSGDVIGYSDQSAGCIVPKPRNFVYRSGTMSAIPETPNDSGVSCPFTAQSKATAIDDNGRVLIGVGLNAPYYTRHPYLYENGSLTDLALNGMQSWAQPMDINSSGQIIYHYDMGSNYQMYVWRSGTAVVLPTLGGSGQSIPYSINAQGQIAGASPPSGWINHAFLWTPSVPNSTSGRIVDLGVLYGGNRSEARAVNAWGCVVGYSETSIPTFQTHAFVYRGCSMEDLNNLIPSGTGWTLEYAYDINDKGQIVGSGTRNGIQRGFLLNPVN